MTRSILLTTVSIALTVWLLRHGHKIVLPRAEQAFKDT